MNKQKLLVILGPTASGKSGLAVELALQFDGEVISADSRQVYRGLDIGSGKITEEEMKGVPHHLLDVVDPTDVYTVADFKRDTDVAIKDILGRSRLPILCGGTGFYIQSVVDNITYPEVPPNEDLRAELKSKNTTELFEQLKELDPNRAETIDPDNPRRLVRAIEIATHLGHVPNLGVRHLSLYNTLQIGLQTDDEILREHINKRVDRRVNDGMLEEVSNLNKAGVSWERLDNLGLEYRYISYYLRGNLEKEEMLQILKHKIWQYAKRQRTWFKRDERIHWLSLTEQVRVIDLVSNFLTDA